MSLSIKLSETDINRLIPKTKVRSLVSHVDGIILSQDIENNAIEIQWTRGEEITTVKHPISKLSSVVLVQ